MVLMEPRRLVMCYKSTSAICQKSKAQFEVSIKPTALCLIHFCPLKHWGRISSYDILQAAGEHDAAIVFISVQFLAGLQAGASL